MFVYDCFSFTCITIRIFVCLFQINSNGYLSTVKDMNTEIEIPYHQPVISIYGTDLYSNSTVGTIFYRQTKSLRLLEEASYDISVYINKVFTAISSVVITFDDVGQFADKSLKHTFQIVLATNGNETYGIFNYRTLESGNVVTGFYGSDCYFKILKNKSTSMNLVNDTNIDLKGTQVHLLTKKTLLCPSPLVCTVQSEKEVCSCISDCSVAATRNFCGSDNKTYTSECTLKKSTCEANATVSIEHVGDCGEGKLIWFS